MQPATIGNLEYWQVQNDRRFYEMDRRITVLEKKKDFGSIVNNAWWVIWPLVLIYIFNRENQRDPSV